MKVLMAAPFNPQGRYAGGVYTIVNGLWEKKGYLLERDINIVPFDTCRIDRSSSKAAKVNMSNIKNTVELWKALKKAMVAEEPNVLYYHSSRRYALLKDLVTIARAKHVRPIKTILHIHFAGKHDILTGKGIIDACMFWLMNQYVDEVAFLSRKTEEEFLEAGLRAKTRVIHNYGQIESCCVTDKAHRHEVYTEFLFVGSIDKRKGIIDLLEAVNRVSTPIRLSICSGTVAEEIKGAFDQYVRNLDTKVVYHGYVSGETKRKVFENADVLVLPSYGEGMPLVIFEAYQAGCAVIATDVGAIGEVVFPENGILVNPGDVDALVTSIEALAKEKSTLEHIQLHNQQIAKQYSIYAFMDKMINACKDVIE